MFRTLLFSHTLLVIGAHGDDVEPAPAAADPRVDPAEPDASSTTDRARTETRLEIALALIAEDKLDAALVVLDLTLRQSPPRADVHLKRAFVREMLAAEVQQASPGGGAKRVDALAAAKKLLREALEDLDDALRIAGPGEVDRDWVGARQRRIKLELAELTRLERRERSAAATPVDPPLPTLDAGSLEIDPNGSLPVEALGIAPASEDPDVLRLRQRRRIGGGIMAGVGVTAGLVGASLAGASFRVSARDRAGCIDACLVEVDFRTGLFAGAMVSALGGAALAGVGTGMTVRNPRPLQLDRRSPAMAIARANSRVNTMRSMGTGLIVLGIGGGAAAAVFSVVAAQRYAVAQTKTELTTDEAAPIARAANAGAGLLAIAPLVAALGGGLRTAVMPQASSAVTFTPHVAPGAMALSMSGHF